MHNINVGIASTYKRVVSNQERYGLTSTLEMAFIFEGRCLSSNIENIFSGILKHVLHKFSIFLWLVLKKQRLFVIINKRDIF